jgi:hypothetical protein
VYTTQTKRQTENGPTTDGALLAGGDGAGADAGLVAGCKNTSSMRGCILASAVSFFFYVVLLQLLMACPVPVFVMTWVQGLCLNMQHTTQAKTFQERRVV